MNLKKLLPKLLTGGSALAVVTLATSGLFKIAAFIREAFIASHFGLSSFTDAYFGFQQFPLVVMTFMFGAFGLAFTPAYASEKRLNGRVAWLPGLLLYGSAGGLLLTLVTTFASPWLLVAFTSGPSAHGAATLFILSCCFAPVIWLGLWAGIAIADGRNVRAMLVAGLPYLLMTLLLLLLYVVKRLDDLSLPLSFLAGFGVIGFCALADMGFRECKWTNLISVLAIWRMQSFRRFLRQLMASSIENVGYSANQLLLVFFLARGGTGEVSANACAMRVGMLGFSLLGQPLAQLVQAKLCATTEGEQFEVFKRWVLAVGGLVLTFAVILYLGREQIVSLVYLRGKFSTVELGKVLEIMPAWVGYFVVISLNAIVARYLFAIAKGRVYVRRQLYAYLAANLMRIAFWGRMSPSSIVWCSVVAEGIALVINLRSCHQQTSNEIYQPQLVGAREV
jgi:peptidoglycan biosynthesis protein MviN/MurJ (putative lipid II flippase)